jgi:hypothetical protein
MGESRLLLVMTVSPIRKFPSIIAVYKTRNITKQTLCTSWLGKSPRKMNSVTLWMLAIRSPPKEVIWVVFSKMI